MSNSLLNEHETMLNVGLGATALYAYTEAFETVRPRAEAAVSMWHIATVLPLIFNEVSRRAIIKRRIGSGLRSILTRDPDNDIAQNEPIFNINRRLKDNYARSMRSLNCAIAWRLLAIENGAILAVSVPKPPSFSGETLLVVNAAKKLGVWSGEMTAFEYLTVLGVEFSQ